MAGTSSSSGGMTALGGAASGGAPASTGGVGNSAASAGNSFGAGSTALAGAPSAGSGGIVNTAGNASASAGSGGKASGGGASGGSSGSNGRGPAPTFTTIYSSIITPNCGGAQCHLKRPTPFGYDFSSKSAAAESWRADVVAGDAENSPMFQVLNLAIMPKDKAPLTIDQLFMIYDWINAGALDN